MQFTENEHCELKACYTEDIKKEIIAFANSNGGTLYIGVQDDGYIEGLANPDFTAQQVANSLRDSVKPDITLFVNYEILRESNQSVLAVRVQRGTNRPYYLSNKGLKPSGVYVRQGVTAAPASDAAIRQMIKETDGDSYEELRSLDQNLTFDAAYAEFHERNMEFGQMQMRSLGIVNTEGLYTNLGLLMSDQCPHIIKAASFAGTDQEAFQDRKEFGGSLLKQLSDAYYYLNMRNRLQATFQGLYRNDCKDYPDTALREALLNAIVHRDYGYSAATLLNVYADRVEMISYGGLAADSSMEDIMMGLSICRNPGLANIFYRLNLIESYGTGIAKIQNAYEGFGKKTEFYASPHAFKVILPNCNYKGFITNTENKNDSIIREQPAVYSTSPASEADYTEEEKKVIDLIRTNGTITRTEVETLTGVSSATAVRLLRRLKEYGAVRTMGNGKNTKYTLSGKDL